MRTCSSQAGQYCPLCGNPIAIAGGNKFQVVTDFETATADKGVQTAPWAIRLHATGCGPAGALSWLGFKRHESFPSPIRP